MYTLDEVVDDYCHALVRVAPWNKQRYEAALEELVAWCEAEVGTAVAVNALDDALTTRYLVTLDPEQRAAATPAIAAFRVWLAESNTLAGRPQAVPEQN
jgi:hypothetical protein